MVREGVEAELNPLDLHAVEEAVRLKDRLGEGTEITVISMGHPRPRKRCGPPSPWGATGGCCSPTDGSPGPIPWPPPDPRSGSEKGRRIRHPPLGRTSHRRRDGPGGPRRGTGSRHVRAHLRERRGIGRKGFPCGPAGGGGRTRACRGPSSRHALCGKGDHTPRLCTLGGKIRAKKTEIPSSGGRPSPSGGASRPSGIADESGEGVLSPITRSGKKVSAADSVDGAVEEILSVLRGRGIV